MLTHIVIWKYKPEITDEQRREHRQMLQNLANIIPAVISLNVGADTLFLARSYDTGLLATFADHAALEIYNNHTEHLKVVAFGREISAHVASVDFVED